jgi:hypothetical protein
MKTLISIALLLAASSAPAAVLITETFETAAGWTGSGSMSVTHSAGQGNPAGSLQGEFAAQGFPIPQTGSFVIDNGLSFMGDYNTPLLTGFTFDLMALTEVPSDVNVIFTSGANTFFYTLNLVGMTFNDWTHFEVALTYSAGWQGDESQFASSLGSVDEVQVQFARGSESQQFFYLDNFGTTAQAFGGGGGAIPEPSSGLLVLFFGVVLLGARKVSFSDMNEEGEWA